MHVKITREEAHIFTPVDLYACSNVCTCMYGKVYNRMIMNNQHVDFSYGLLEIYE